MKKNILFIGNQGNTGYRICSWLKILGYRVNLLLPKNADNRSSPAWENANLKEKQLEWIHKFKFTKSGLVISYYKYRRLIRQADVIITNGWYIIPCLLLRKKLFFIPVGADLSELPYRSNSIKHLMLSLLYIRNIKKVNKIFVTQEDCLWSSKLLGVEKKVIPFSLPIDIETMSANVSEEFLELLKDKYEGIEMLLFNPSRKIIDPYNRAYKGSEKLIRALRVFLKEYPDAAQKVRFVTVMNGNDIERVEELIDELKFPEGFIVYEDHMDLRRLFTYFKFNKTVVAGAFNESARNTLGGVSRETLGFGKILINSTDGKSDGLLKLYKSPVPNVCAESEHEIYDAIRRVYLMGKAERKKLEEKVIRWSTECLDWNSQILKITDFI